jgi:translation initiation factor IF-3
MLRAFSRYVRQGNWAGVEPILSQPEFVEQAKLTVYPKNEEIKAPGKVTVTDWKNQVIGQTTLSKALVYAQGLKLDAVLVQPDPPVVKLMDYSKYLAQQVGKKYVKAYREHNFATLKTYVFRSRIEDHDIEVKLWRLQKSLFKFGKVILEFEEIDEEEDLTTVRRLAGRVLERLQSDEAKWQDISCTATETEYILRFELTYNRKLSDLIQVAKEKLEASELSVTNANLFKKVHLKIDKFHQKPFTEEQEDLFNEADSLLENLKETSYSRSKLIEFLCESNPDDLLDLDAEAQLENYMADIGVEEELTKKVGTREAYRLMALKNEA